MTPDQLNKLKLVREKLFNLYEKFDFEGGKNAEGVISIIYPSIWDANKTFEPYELQFYSYVFGPSRNHHIWLSDENRRIDSNNWHATDIFECALQILDEWEKELISDEEELKNETTN